MTIEEIIEQIRSQHPEISKEEIAERLKKEKHRTSGFITEDTLLRMIAADLGMETQAAGFTTPTLSTADLVPGLRDVTVVGRVVAVFPVKAFNGNRNGRFASFLVADESSIVRVLMWNDRTDLVESGKIKVGQIVRISHGYTKDGRGGKVELHVGQRCRVDINPPDVEQKSYPTISKFATKISKITHDQKNKKASVIGTVKRIFSASTFERQDSTSGKVMRFILADETGEISIVVWNEKVDELQTMLKENAGLQIVDAKLKKSMEEKPELHIDSATYVGAFMPDEQTLKISDLKEGMSRVNLEGEVATRPILREVKTFKKEIVNLASFELKDKTAKIWVSAWGKHTSLACDLKVGDRILLKNAYVRRGFGDQLEISTRETTSLNVVH
jgi:ssDNA-binding replication factor A large subunit